jgi:hypothetical protein
MPYSRSLAPNPIRESKAEILVQLDGCRVYFARNLRLFAVVGGLRGAMDRRRFLKTSVAGLALLAARGYSDGSAEQPPVAKALPQALDPPGGEQGLTRRWPPA